nr:MAG TPA: tail tube protein [Caudoviricetes sp.]
MANAVKKKPLPTIGVDRYTFFKLETDTAEKPIYGEPYTLKGLVEIAPTDSGGSEPFEADNGIYEVSSYIEKIGHDITNADIPPEVDAIWRGLEQKNGLTEVDTNIKTVYFATAWRLLKSDNTYRYVRYYKGAYSFASNVGGKTKKMSGAPEKQTAKATYTAVQRDCDNKYYAYIDEADLPADMTRVEFEEKWFTDVNWYPNSIPEPAPAE